MCVVPRRNDALSNNLSSISFNYATADAASNDLE